MHREVRRDRRFAQLECVDVHDGLVGVTREGLVLVADLADVQTTADAEQEVRVLYAEVAGAIAERARAAGVERMIVPQQVAGIPGGHRGGAEQRDDVEKIIGGARRAHTGAGEYDRPLGAGETLDELVDLAPHEIAVEPRVVVERGRRRAPSALDLGLVDQRTLDVDRHVEPDRSRPATRHEGDGGVEMAADARRLDDHGGVLGDRPHDVDDRRLLVAELTQWQATQRYGRVGAHLTRQVEHRHRVVPLTEDARHGVGAARSARHADDAGASADAGMALGGDGAGLFMVAEDGREPGAARERVVEVHGAAARDHEHVARAELGQPSGDVVGDLDHLRLPAFLDRPCRRPPPASAGGATTPLIVAIAALTCRRGAPRGRSAGGAPRTTRRASPPPRRPAWW